MKETYQRYIESGINLGEKKCEECKENMPHWKSKYCSDKCQRKKYGKTKIIQIPRTLRKKKTV